MKYDPTEICCPVPGSNEAQLQGLGSRIEMLNALCMEMMCAVAELHCRTFADTAIPDVKDCACTISDTVDHAIEAARISLDRLKAYLSKL